MIWLQLNDNICKKVLSHGDIYKFKVMIFHTKWKTIYLTLPEQKSLCDRWSDMPKQMGKYSENGRNPASYSRSLQWPQSLIYFIFFQGYVADRAMVLEEFFSYFSPVGQLFSPRGEQGGFGELLKDCKTLQRLRCLLYQLSDFIHDPNLTPSFQKSVRRQCSQDRILTHSALEPSTKHIHQ